MGITHHMLDAGQSLRNDLRGSVAIVTAVGMTAMIYTAAISLDLADLYYIKSVDQRIADQSAIAAAFAYTSSGSTVTAQKEAISLATANGGTTATVTADIVNSPSGDGAQAAYVVVTSPVPLSGFGRATTRSAAHPTGLTSFTVSAYAYAEIHGASPCILATQTGGKGFTASGGTHIIATACDVYSNASVALTNGPVMTASATSAVGSISVTGGSTLNGQQFPNSSKQADPYANASVFARLSNSFFTNPVAPSFPTLPSAPVGGSDVACTGTMTVAANSSYGTITAGTNSTCNVINFSGGGTTSILCLFVSGPALTVNFGPGTYKIGKINLNGYGNVAVNLSGTPTMDLYSGFIFTGSQPVSFTGAATWNIESGMYFHGSSTVSFSNGSGASTSAFTVAGGITDNNTGAITFPSGTYNITSSSSTSNNYGVSLGGGATLTMGQGSFDIADGIDIAGSASLTIGGPLNSSSVFEIPTVSSGNDAILTGGGSMLSIGGFTNYDINGEVRIESNFALGGGTFTVNGELDVASNGGGTVTAPAASFIASGLIAFGAGFNSVTVTAPSAITSATEGSISTVALASQSSGTSTVESGATDTAVTGAVYFPNGPLTVTGGGNINGAGNCLQVVAQSIAVSAQGSLSTNCSSLGVAAGVGSVTLVQ